MCIPQPAPAAQGQEVEIKVPTCLERLHVNNATCPGMFRGPSKFALSKPSKAFLALATVES